MVKVAVASLGRTDDEGTVVLREGVMAVGLEILLQEILQDQTCKMYRTSKTGLGMLRHDG